MLSLVIEILCIWLAIKCNCRFSPGSGCLPTGNRGIQLMPLPFDDVWGSSTAVNVERENRNNVVDNDDETSQTTIC